MNKAYRLPSTNPKAQELAEKITALIIDSAVTYRVAMDALDVAAEELEQKTVPKLSPQKSD